MTVVGCALCDLEPITSWYYEDEEWIICDCASCVKKRPRLGAPMIVLRDHWMPANDVEKKVTEQRAEEIAKHVFGERFSHMGKRQRKVLDHFHRHIYLKEE